MVALGSIQWLTYARTAKVREEDIEDSISAVLNEYDADFDTDRLRTRIEIERERMLSEKSGAQ